MNVGNAKIRPKSENNGTEGCEKPLMTPEEFRDRYNRKKSADALARYRKVMEESPNSDSHFTRYLTDGREAFVSNMMSSWQNVALTSALIGAISLTVALSAPSSVDSLSSTSGIQFSSDQLRGIGRCFYVAWSLGAISELASVLLVTIASMHFNLLMNDDDIVWFLMKWEFIVLELPQVFLVVGCFCCSIGLALGVMMIADRTTAIICSGTILAILVIVLGIWLWMLAVNKMRERMSVLEVRQMLSECTLYIPDAASKDDKTNESGFVRAM